MTIVQRFYLNEHDRVIDNLSAIDNAEVVWWDTDPPKDETCLRECVLGRRLSCLVNDLIVDTAPTSKLSNTKDRQALTLERYFLWSTLRSAIGASHLNTFDVALSLEQPFAGELKREKVGWQASTSLSLFVDDVERLLGDLYGESDSLAIDRLRDALLVIVREFTRHLRKDLCKEHEDAQAIDYVCGIGVPEGYCIGGSDHGYANRARRDVALCARAVRANPAAFSKYTVEFVKVLDEEWPTLDAAADDKEPELDPELAARITTLIGTV
jgi:hypothetical protein